MFYVKGAQECAVNEFFKQKQMGLPFHYLRHCMLPSLLRISRKSYLQSAEFPTRDRCNQTMLGNINHGVVVIAKFQKKHGVYPGCEVLNGGESR